MGGSEDLEPGLSQQARNKVGPLGPLTHVLGMFSLEDRRMKPPVRLMKL